MTVPQMALVIAALAGPIAVNLVVNFLLPLCKLGSRVPYDTRDFVLTLVQALSMEGLLINFIKRLAGRLRPSFYDMCGWQFDVVWDGSSNLCTDAAGEDEARQSFPSGHSSFAWASMLVLTVRGRVPSDRYASADCFGLFAALPFGSVTPQPRQPGQLDAERTSDVRKAICELHPVLRGLVGCCHAHERQLAPLQRRAGRQYHRRRHGDDRVQLQLWLHSFGRRGWAAIAGSPRATQGTDRTAVSRRVVLGSMLGRNS